MPTSDATTGTPTTSDHDNPAPTDKSPTGAGAAADPAAAHTGPLAQHGPPVGDTRPSAAGWMFGPALFSALPSPMALVSISGVVATVNDAWRELVGDDGSVDIGRPLWRRFVTAERAHVAAVVEQLRGAACDTPQGVPTVTGTRIERADGTGIDVALRLSTSGDRGRTRLLVAQLEPLAVAAARDRRRPGTGDHALALAAIARAVAAGGPSQRTLRGIITSVARATGCPLVGLWRRPDRQHALVLCDGVGFDAHARGRLALDSDEHGLANHALRARTVVEIGCPTGTAAALPTVLRDRGVTSGAAITAHGVAGADAVLTVCATHNQPLPAADLRLLAIVGDLLSVVLQRESVDDIIAAERHRTADVAADLDSARRRLSQMRRLTDVREWTWIRPRAVTTDQRVEPPPRWSLDACLDAGPQALVDTATSDDADALAATINACLEEGADFDCAARIRTADGVLTIALCGRITRGPDGQVQHVSGVATATPPAGDRTSPTTVRPAIAAPDTARTATTATDDEARRLAHTAHDLNNLLAAVLGTAEHAAEHGASRQQLTAIVRAGRRARELVAGLGPERPLDHPLAGSYEIADVVAQLQPLLPGLVGDTIAVEYALRHGARTTRPTREELERILLDLVSNSRDALPEGGTIRIGVDTCIQLDADSAGHRSPPIGSWARLRVRDDGTGIATSARSHVFRPGYTTKRASRHAGLGLAAVHDTVAAAAGVVNVTSAAGRGTLVDIYLPLETRAPVRLEPLRAHHPTVRHHREPVALVVDDDDAVRALLVDLVGDLGYEVVTAVDGHDAVACGQRLQRVDLIISDARMPGIDGMAVIDELRSLHEDIAAVLVSGAPPARHPSDARTRVVTKPFALAELRQAITGAINAGVSARSQVG